MAVVETIFIAVAGLAGVAGVALSAAASHGPGGPVLETAARFLLIHAAALVGLSALLAAGAVPAGLGRWAGLAMLVGLALFCGDLVARTYWGRALFPIAAPAGGILLMAGWGLVTVAALVRLVR